MGTQVAQQQMRTESENRAWVVCTEHKGQGFCVLFFFFYIFNFYQGEIHVTYNIFKWTIQYQLVHSQYCATTISIWF